MAASQEYLQQYGHTPVFLSDWDADPELADIPHIDFSTQHEEERPYYYWTDEGGFRDTFVHFCSEAFGLSVDPASFTIASNGTSSILLTLMGLRELDVTNLLVFTPVYFSTLNILEKLNFNVIEHSLQFGDDFKIDFDLLKQQIQEHKVQAIFLTSPVFGSGVEIPDESLDLLVDLCNNYDIWLILDYVYGGLLWDDLDTADYIFNHTVYNKIHQAKKSVLIESISKRLFLNGSKVALVFSSPSFIRRMLRLSICTVGSMCYAQLRAFETLYKRENTGSLVNLMNQTIQNAQRNYMAISAMLLGADIQISKCHSSYFALLQIPKPLNAEDVEHSISLLQKTGVLTIPHSRYRLFSCRKYCFRVNLLKQRDIIITSLTALKNLS